MEALKNTAMCEYIEEHIRTDSRLAGQLINVTCTGGYAQLYGVVDSIEIKELAIELVRGIAGVHRVEDHLELRRCPTDISEQDK